MTRSGPMLAAMIVAVAATAATLVAAGAPKTEPEPAKSAESPAVCPKCRTPVASDWKHCPACGKKLPDGKAWYDIELNADFAWLAVGFTGQLAFALRFFFQWLVSERRGESVIPPSFWWLSLIAGLMVLCYGVRNREPIVILSQAFNPIIYIRNIMLIRRNDHHGAGSVISTAAEDPATPAAPPK